MRVADHDSKTFSGYPPKNIDCWCVAVQVRSLLPVKELCEEVEKRNKLRLLDKFLKVLVEEGSQDPDVHNAMGKILIDANSNPEHFLQSNPFYQPAVVGKYCEKRCVPRCAVSSLPESLTLELRSLLHCLDGVGSSGERPTLS